MNSLSAAALRLCSHCT